MKKVEHKPSKRFLTASSLVEPKKAYSIDEAIALVKKTSNVKFDAAVEIHVNLGINAKKTDQTVRSSISLPHGTGKTVRVAVITADPDKQKKAREAGADLVGDKEIIEEIKAGKINFDVLVTTPDSMKVLGPIAKILGPRGLMPNPKDGTVTQNVTEIIGKLKKGQISYKNDDSGNVHAIIGKISFTEQQLKENYQAFLDNLTKAKPVSSKGTFIKNISLSSSMGPGIKVAI